MNIIHNIFVLDIPDCLLNGWCGLVCGSNNKPNKKHHQCYHNTKDFDTVTVQKDNIVSNLLKSNYRNADVIDTKVAELYQTFGDITVD